MLQTLFYSLKGLGCDRSYSISLASNPSEILFDLLRKSYFQMQDVLWAVRIVMLWIWTIAAACSGQGLGLVMGSELVTENSEDLNRTSLLDLNLIGQDEVVVMVPKKRVGMFYLGWDTPAATAVRQLQQNGHTVVTMEQVLRSDGMARVSQILAENNLLSTAADFHYSIEPNLGFYCLYRARPGEVGVYPDCPDIANIARTHAEQLVSSGVDFIVMDGTNLDVFDPFSDVIQLRPFEVLLEEWSKLRQQGIPTPEIAMWARLISPHADLYEKYLHAYNNPDFASVIMKDRVTGKKVLFRVDHQDSRPDLEELIAQNGGMHNITVVPMWGNMPSESYAKGIWSFMSPCEDRNQLTVSILNRSCQQRMTVNSPLGTQIAISLSYQLRYASEPFGASGKLGGLTLRRQFERAFRDQPDYLLLNGWNEFVAQPQDGAAGIPMGLEDEPSSDLLYGRDWVDTYGNEFNRSFEPTKESGTYYFDLLQSCLRVYRSGHPVCDDEQEACCSKQQGYVNVYSLERVDGLGHLWTIDNNERNVLAHGGGWNEVCAGLPTTTEFYCARSNDTFGPFIIFNEPGPDRMALYRCYNGSFHSLTTDICVDSNQESLLGYVSTFKSSTTPRSLRQCRSSTRHLFHVLSASCPPEAQDVGFLGYVK